MIARISGKITGCLRLSSILLIVTGLLLGPGAAGASEPIAAPASVNFGVIPIGYPQASTVRIIDTDSIAEGIRVLSAVTDPPAYGFQVVAFDSHIRKGGVGRVQLIFDPLTDGEVKSALVLDVRVSEPTGQKPYLLTVPLVGTGICTDVRQDCEPAGRLCTVDPNSESAFNITVPDFQERVSPTINLHWQTHLFSSTSYSMPLSHLWHIAGIKDTEITRREGAAKDCFATLTFTHIPRLNGKVRFRWEYTGEDAVVAGVFDNSTLRFEIRLSNQIAGFCVLSGSYLELHFDQAAAPSLMIEDGPTEQFLGRVSCMGTGHNRAYVRHADAAEAAPRLHLELHK